MDANKTNHFFVINSADKLSGETETNFSSKAHQFNHTKAFGIKEILIPYTYYNVNSTNNTLVIFKTGDTQERTITLPPGNYNITDFLARLKVFLDASPGVLHTYTCTYDVNTYKITITQDSSTFVIFANSTMKHLLGLGLIDPVAAISHTSANVFDLGYTNFIKIYSNTLTKYDTRVRTSGSDGTSLMCIVPIHDAVFATNIRWKPKAFYLDYHSHNEDRIDIRLVDMHGNNLGGDTGLNGKNLYIKLNFLTNSSNDERKVNRYDSRLY